MPDITCFACEREPTQQCPRCGRPYCFEHGEELCDACMRPASGVPPGRLYYGSIFALLIGTVLAIYFFIQPADSAENGTLTPLVFTPTAAAAQIPTAPAATAPAGTQTPAASGTPSATRTAAPSTTGTPAAGTATPSSGNQSYTVQSGDTLSSICNRFKPASMDLQDCIQTVVRINNLDSEDDLTIGQTLQVPR